MDGRTDANVLNSDFVFELASSSHTFLSLAFSLAFFHCKIVVLFLNTSINSNNSSFPTKHTPPPQATMEEDNNSNSSLDLFSNTKYLETPPPQEPEQPVAPTPTPAEWPALPVSWVSQESLPPASSIQPGLPTLTIKKQPRNASLLFN